MYNADSITVSIMVPSSILTCLCSILQLSPLHPSILFPTHCSEQCPDEIPYSTCVHELCENFPAAHSGQGETWIERDRLQVYIHAGAPGTKLWRRDLPCVQSWPESWWRWQWVIPQCLPNTSSLWRNCERSTYLWDQSVWINWHMVEEDISTMCKLMKYIFNLRLR